MEIEAGNNASPFRGAALRGSQIRDKPGTVHIK
jgi:hypothetical protein